MAGSADRDAPAMGRWLREARHVPDQVLCSTARRACETWQLLRDSLQAAPPVTFDDLVYRASAAQLIELVRGTAAATHALLIVGHDPAIPELALTLAHAATEDEINQSDARNRIAAKFPTAAIAILQHAGTWDELHPGSAKLTRFVTPRDLTGSRGPDGKAK